MHVPGHNPYLTEWDDYTTGSYDYTLNQEGLSGYLENLGLDPSTYGDMITNWFQNFSDFHSQVSPDMQEFAGWLPFGETLGQEGYTYQGMSPEIMSALGNVFNPEITSGVDWSADTAISDWLSQLQAAPDTLYSNIGNADFWNQMATQTGQLPIDYMYQFGGGPSDIAQFVEVMGEGEFEQPEGLNLFGANIFDPESIAATLSQIADLNMDLVPGDADYETLGPIRAAEVKALTPEMIEKTTGAYYSPYEETEREELVEKLGEATSRAGTGGFAGSGIRQSGLSGAERLYRGGYEDILSQIEKLKAQSTEDVLDTIYGWQELLSSQ